MNAEYEHPNAEELSAFMAGTLDVDEHERIAAHIADCDECCDTLRTIPEDALSAQLKEVSVISNVVPPSVDRTLPNELLEHPRYKIGKFLGSGGMGLVYQAEHRIMDRVVALKILHRELIQNPRVVKRFRQEVKAAARLSHPNIVVAYDADQAGESHFLVMEFVDGVSLQRLVRKRGPLEPGYACYFIRQAAKGLAHAFQAGMVHRDIKPQNLMLTRNGQVKILDFGLARLASETMVDAISPLFPGVEGPEVKGTALTNHGDVMGTPDYMAPEQARDSSQADIRADIYSLGCTLYYLLTGHTPYSPGTARAKLLAKQDAAPQSITTWRDDLQPALIQIIEKMMARDPGQRFQAPGDVVKALAPFAKPAPVAAPTPAKKADATPSDIVDAAGNEPNNFLARCPFCVTRIRIPARALGASLPCPQCNSYFTAVPDDDGNTSF